MSFRRKILDLVEVLLRVPPLFVIDEILKIGLGLSELTEYDLTDIDEKIGDSLLNYSTPIHYDPTFYRFIIVSLYRLFLSIVGCAVALCLFALSTRYLLVVYMYLMSVGIVFVSYWTNLSMMKSITALLNESDTIKTSILDDLLSLNISKLTDSAGYVSLVLQNYLLQSLFSFLFANIHLGPRFPLIQKLILVTFLMPSILAVLPVPPNILMHTPVFAALLPLALVKFVLWSSLVTVIQILCNGYLQGRNFISNFGMSVLIESEWVRLSVPKVLRTFWILRVSEHAVIFFMNGRWSEVDELTPAFRLIKNLMVTGCDTLTAVLGITSVVSYICHYIGKFFQWILLTEDDNDKSIGTVSAILFYVLALQTGLTGLEPEKRFIRLCRNFCLLFTALLHFIHNIVNPLLMSLSASHNSSLKRHFRALLVCTFLIVFPVLLLYYLWSSNDASTWLLAVSAFSIEVIVKVGVSLCIYLLFLLDARRETFWEELDDYVYYIRAFGNTVEFCFGIFLFFNGAWILVFESGGAIRAVMMCIHAYFNIWCDARAGWSVFMKRRTAVHKIESLPEADEEQLQRLNDVCAICYQEMRSAKITRCRHFFHGVCLRKWLYVQDRCPLCHEVLHTIECGEIKDSSSQHLQQQQQQQQPVQQQNEEVNR